MLSDRAMVKHLGLGELISERSSSWQVPCPVYMNDKVNDRSRCHAGSIPFHQWFYISL